MPNCFRSQFFCFSKHILRVMMDQREKRDLLNRQRMQSDQSLAHRQDYNKHINLMFAKTKKAIKNKLPATMTWRKHWKNWKRWR